MPVPSSLVIACFSGGALPKSSGATCGLGLVQPGAVDFDSLFKVANGSEVLLHRGPIVLAELLFQTLGLVLHPVENAAGVSHFVAPAGARLLGFDAEQPIENGFGAILGVDRRLVAAPGKRRRAIVGQHQRRDARLALVEIGDLLVDRDQFHAVGGRVHAGQQAGLLVVAAAESLQFGENRAIGV